LAVYIIVSVMQGHTYMKFCTVKTKISTKQTTKNTTYSSALILSADKGLTCCVFYKTDVLLYKIPSLYNLAIIKR